MSDTDVPAWLTEGLASYVVGNSISCAVTVSVAYDIILTFPEEIELVWRQKGRWINFLFWANRYLVPSQAVVAMLSAMDPNMPIDYDHHNVTWNVDIFSNVWIVPIVITLIEALQILRVNALYHGNRLVPILLWSLLAIYLVAALVLSVQISAQMNVEPSQYPFIYGSGFAGTDIGMKHVQFITATGSRLTFVFSLQAIVWILSTINEMLLVCLLIGKTASYVLASRKGAPLLTLILRDGCLYFLVIFGMMLVNVAFHHLAGEYEGWANVFIQPELCISSILCSRLFFNLRAQVLRPQIEVTTMSNAENGGRDMEMARRGEESSDWRQTQWTEQE